MTIESEIEEDISNSVLVMGIQERRAGPEYFARIVKKGLEQKNGVEKFEQFY